MKVLLIDVYNYNKGGAETVCFNTGNLLQQHGHDVIYFTLKWKENNPSLQEKYFPESKETRKGPLKQIKNVINYFYHFEAAKKIETLIIKEKPDLAHIHLMWGQITSSILPILKKYNIPIIYTVHDYRLICPAYTFRNGKGNICEDCKGKHFYKCFTNKCTKGNWIMSAVMAAEQYFRNKFFYPLKFIDGIIYVSNFAQEIHKKYMPLTQKKKHITLYNFSKSIIDSPKEVPLEKYYLFLGRLSYEKGIETLIKAFTSLTSINLKIAGTGPLETELKAQTQELKNIEFLGYKKGKELEALISKAYMVIVPSEWYENNPMSIIESYAVGTPVIGSNIGGIPEIIQENTTGFIFESGNVNDLISRIVKAENINDKQYKEISQGCINFANKYLSADNYWNKLIEFYSLFVHS